MCRGRVEPDHMAICSKPSRDRPGRRGGRGTHFPGSGQGCLGTVVQCKMQRDPPRPDPGKCVPERPSPQNASQNNASPKMHPVQLLCNASLGKHYFGMRFFGCIILGCIFGDAIFWDALSRAAHLELITDITNLAMPCIAMSDMR